MHHKNKVCVYTIIKKLKEEELNQERTYKIKLKAVRLNFTREA